MKDEKMKTEIKLYLNKKLYEENIITFEIFRSVSDKILKSFK